MRLYIIFKCCLKISLAHTFCITLTFVLVSALIVPLIKKLFEIFTLKTFFQECHTPVFSPLTIDVVLYRRIIELIKPS